MKKALCFIFFVSLFLPIVFSIPSAALAKNIYYVSNIIPVVVRNNTEEKNKVNGEELRNTTQYYTFIKDDLNEKTCAGKYDTDTGTVIEYAPSYTTYTMTDNRAEGITDFIATYNEEPSETREFNGVTYNIVYGYNINHIDNTTNVEPFNFNTYTSGDIIYLYYTKDPSVGAPVTVLEFSDVPKFEPYNCVKTAEGEKVDLNRNALKINDDDSSIMYMYFARELTEEEAEQLQKKYDSLDENEDTPKTIRNVLIIVGCVIAAIVLIVALVIVIGNYRYNKQFLD